MSDRSLFPRPTEAEIARLQLQALEAWHRARRIAEQAAAVAHQSREARMDLDRRLEVLRAQHEVIIRRTEDQLRESVRLMRALPSPRAVVAHRNEWFRAKVCADLQARGVDVLAQVENGAEAVGILVAEQPELMLVEDRLEMISGEEVVREARRYAPATLIAAQVAYEDRIGPMLEAGANTAYTRRVPPLDVAADLYRLLVREDQRV
jgi:CheY-like chemotaxis protein